MNTNYDSMIHTSQQGITPSDVGNKAYFLFRLASVCQLPPLVCVDAGAFQLFLQCAENKALHDRISQAFSNRIGLLNVLDEIREAVSGMYVPPEFEEALARKIAEARILGTVAVRSSSQYEDGVKHSGAGVYESYTDVPPEHAAAYVRKCWASQFSVKTLSYHGEITAVEQLRMGVIVQQYVPAERSGVIFSVDPVCPEKGMRIELVRGNCERLMSGEQSADLIRHGVVSEGKCFLSDADYQSELEQLCLICDQVRQQLGYEVDMEWASGNGELYILQCRPITTVMEEPKCEWLKTILDLPDIPQEEMGALVGKMRSFQKKYKFYRYADAAGVPILPWFFLRYSKNSDIDAFVRQIKGGSEAGDYAVMLNSILTDFQCSANGLAALLRKMLSISKTEYITVSVRFIQKNQYSLISFYDPLNRQIRIECVPGVMKGLKSGYLQPTVYLTDANAQILSEEPVRYRQYYDIDIDTDQFYLVSCDMTVSGITEQIRQIAAYTVQLYGQFVFGVVEWWICGGTVYAADCSIEKGQVTADTPLVSADGRTVLSKGHVRGGVFLITDDMIADLDSFSYSCAVSVTSYDESIGELDTIKSLREQIRAVRDKYGSVILAAEHPFLSLSPFLDAADGIVFREASLLCHLSVIIRERQIPAVCIGAAFADLRTDSFYTI